MKEFEKRKSSSVRDNGRGEQLPHVLGLLHSPSRIEGQKNLVEGAWIDAILFPTGVIVVWDNLAGYETSINVHNAATRALQIFKCASESGYGILSPGVVSESPH